MPHIPQNVVNSVFYLYATKEDALGGRDPGGTGFIVSYGGSPIERIQPHFYGVTNWHVACAGGFPVIRINTKDGGVDVIDLDSSQWEFLPGKYDVAVVPITLDYRIHDVASVGTWEFAAMPPPANRQTPSDLIGVGEDVFMIGLFVDHGGVAINVPSAKFGNISMLPNPQATIEQPTGYNGVS